MLRSLFLLALLLALPGAASPVRLCVVGDSISEGFSPATRGWSSYVKAAHANEDFGVRNVAESGIKVAAAQAIFDLELAGRNCTHLAFLIGTNDLPDGTSAATIYAAIDAMMDAAEAGGARSIGLAILPRGTGASWSSDLGTRLLALNALLAARTSSVPALPYLYVDTYTALLEPASNPPALATAAGGATDGLHPNNAGQLLIAQTVDAAVLASGGW